MAKRYWDVWHRKLRVKLFYLFPEKVWETRLGFFLYYNNFVLDGESEDCWCGNFELGPDD